MLASDSAVNWPVSSHGSSAIGTARLAVGLLQGLVLYLLYSAVQDETWPATEPLWFSPLFLMWLIAPVLLISSIGVLNRRQLLVWIPVAAAIMAALGVYDVWRTLGVPDLGAFNPNDIPAPSPPLLGFSVAGFFIAQSLVMAAVREQRRIASYAGYFETAWKHFVQLAFSALFVGVVWAVLMLGAELFMLIKLDFLRELTRKSWFVIPVTVFAFSCAVHITDVRPAIVRGIRTLLLVLMSWILPVAVLVIGGFLLSLPFTGFAPLWATRSATSVLLGAAALLVVLINAAYQDGAPENAVVRVVRASARVAVILLVPITLIAGYALALRVGDYGWTTSRIAAAACLLVAACYAAGYARSALRPGWLGSLAGTNIATALVVLAVLLLLFSPVADPARLSVWHQVARLQSGQVAPEKFDFAYLRFEGERYGKAALADLNAGAHGKDAQLIRDRITAARSLKRRPGPFELKREQPSAIKLSAAARVWPKGSQLPPSFPGTDLKSSSYPFAYPSCLHGEGDCDLVLVDLTADSKPEIVVLGSEEEQAVVMGQDQAGKWGPLGRLPWAVGPCKALRQKLIEGQFKVVAPAIRELEVAGTRLSVVSTRALPGPAECAAQAH
ncbi:MAG TPA: DUF4153 domain-containing protein [Telluria sp.]